MQRFYFLLTILLLAAGISTHKELCAQDVPESCIGGTQYYIAYPDTVKNMQDGRHLDRSPESLGLLIYSPVDQMVEISRRGTPPVSMRVDAGTMIEYTDKSTLASPIVTVRNRVDSQSVVSVSAEHPIVIYAYYSTNFGTAGFTPLPVESWGNEYFAASWPAEVVRNIVPAGETRYNATQQVEAPAQILVIASEDDTEVTLSPNWSLACAACSTFTLDRGEAYLVQSKVDTSGQVEFNVDIAGTYIFSSRPVGVISGNTRTLIEDFPFPMLARNSPKDLTAEWLPPTIMHGRDFVFTPTLDKVRQGNGNSTLPERESEEVRVFATVEDGTVVSGYNNQKVIDVGEFAPLKIGGLKEGVVINASKSAQAFHAIRSVGQFNGTTGSGNFLGASFSAWGSAMVEMIPRRRWTSMVPFRAPTIREDMEHYVTVITDKEHRDDIWLQRGNAPRMKLSFDKEIRNSSVVWTHLSVDTGVTYRLTGENGARFTGHLQGGFRGFEKYTPGGTREDEKDREAAALHPSEYEEQIAGMYAMPLSGSTCPTTQEELYLIEILESGCNGATYRITRADGGALDLAYLRMAQGRTENVRMEFLEPVAGPQALDTARVTVVRLRRINPAAGGRVVLQLRDEAGVGEEVEIVLNLPIPTLEIDPNEVLVGDESEPVEVSVTLRNSSSDPVELSHVELAFGNRGFSIVRTTPKIPWDNAAEVTTVIPGDSIVVTLRYDPEVQDQSLDSLAVNLICNRLVIPLRGSASAQFPCITVGDLDFGLLSLGAERTLQLEICNRGEGVLTFEPTGPGGALVDWLVKEFTISASDIQLLTTMNLAPNQCVTIRVSFRSSETSGDFRTVARFYTNETTGECRDSSVWTAQVGTVSVGEESRSAGGLTITSIAPNPGDGVVRLRYSDAREQITEVALLDATGCEHRVEITDDLTGEIVLNLADLPSGLYFVRLISAGNEVVRSVMIVR